MPSPAVRRTLLCFMVALFATLPGLRVASAQDESASEHVARIRVMKQAQFRRLMQGAAREARERRENADLLRRAKHSARARQELARRRGERMKPDLSDEDVLAGRLRPGTPSSRLRAGVERALSVPTNVLVNNRSGDGANAGQSEQEIAMLGNNGMSAWNDGQAFNDPTVDGQGLAITTNGGATWTDIVYPPHPVGTQYFSDPSVTVNEKTGDFYFCALTTDSSVAPVGDGIAIVRGQFSGGSIVWDTPHNARYDVAGLVGFDKQWLVADSSTRNLYLSYTTFTAGGDSILFQSSTDNGVTWSAPIGIAAYDGGVANFGVQGSRPAVGPDGEVYVTWFEISATSDQDFVKVRKSNTQGVSFAAAVKGGFKIANSGSGAPGFNRDGGIDFPSIAVDRSAGTHRGRVYLAWNESVDYYDAPLGALTNANARVEGAANNNFFNRAIAFTPGNTLRGTLNPATTDLDYFTFTATAGTTYFFYMDSSTTSTAFAYTMRIFCSDTTARLAFTTGQGQGPGTGSTSAVSYYAWSPPVTGTYYLRMAPVSGNSSTAQYRIRTAIDPATPAFDHARDDRDVFTAFSDNGTAWSAAARVNDDAVGFDDWLPEVAVTDEGYAYAEWFDWRDAAVSCGGWSHVYTSRSTDGGVTWTPNTAVTNVQTAWTSTGTNIAPNQGDYNGLYGGDQLAYNFADGRLGDVDVFMAKLSLGFPVTAPPDTTVDVNVAATSTFGASNQNVLFAHTLNYSLASERAWPGFPITGSVTLAAGASPPLGFAYNVPDTAAIGVNHLCLTLSTPNGSKAASACQAVTVTAALGVFPSGPRFALAGATRNPVRSGLDIGFSLPDGARATLEVLDLSGRRMASREVGGMGAGSHVVSFAREASRLPAGVYAIRLSRAGRALSTKVAVIH